MINATCMNDPSKINKASNTYYVTTACGKNGKCAEILLDGDDYVRLQNDVLGIKSMFDYRFMKDEDGFIPRPVDSIMMTRYMKALNGIFPKGVSYNPKIPAIGSNECENTVFKCRGNSSGSTLIVDKVTKDKSGREHKEEVLSITPQSILH